MCILIVPAVGFSETVPKYFGLNEITLRLLFKWTLSIFFLKHIFFSCCIHDPMKKSGTFFLSSIHAINEFINLAECKLGFLLGCFWTTRVIVESRKVRDNVS